MTLAFVRGDMFADPGQALVNPVNCIGTMGAGLAKEFKRRFPAESHEYAKAARCGKIKIGSVFATEALFSAALGRVIVHVPTKRHWRDASTMADVRASTEALSSWVLAQTRPGSVFGIAIPALGCGCGGLQWANVRFMLEDVFAWAVERTDVAVRVYEPW